MWDHVLLPGLWEKVTENGRTLGLLDVAEDVRGRLLNRGCMKSGATATGFASSFISQHSQSPTFNSIYVCQEKKGVRKRYQPLSVTALLVCSLPALPESSS